MFPLPERKRAKAARAGFTMIDMLISMALLSMVMTMVYGAFGQISTKAVALTEGPFMRPIAVLYRRGRSLPLGVKKFLDVLTEDTAQPTSESVHSRV